MDSHKRIHKLGFLVKIATKNERNASQELEKKKILLEAAKNSIINLKSYRSEYLSQYDNESNKGISTDKLQNYKKFLDNLNLAIKQHQEKLSSVEMQYELSKAEWREKYNKLNGLNKIVDGASAKINTEKMRVEQKLSDELTTLRGHHNSTGSGH